MLAKTALEYEVVTFTPEEAGRILENHSLSRNRTIRQSWVDTLAKEMKSKNWDLNGQTIVFAKDGSLLDGHHRLWACFEGGTPFTTCVIRNVNAETFDTIDVGRVRTGADMLYSGGTHKYHRAIATATGLIIRYNSGKIVNAKKLLPREITAFFNAHTDLETWIEAASKGEMRPYAAPIGAVVYLGGAVRHRTKATEFVDKLVTGADLPSGSPILALRNRLLAGGSFNGRGDGQVDRFALCIQAWNAYMEGRSLKRMQIFLGEKFPKIRGASV